MGKNDLDSMLMNIFFTYAWRLRKLKCECGCGKYLPREINKACMDHLLLKSVSPECKYSISNIMFVRSECHERRTNGFPNEEQQKHIDWAMENKEMLTRESSTFVNRIMNKLKLEDNVIYNKE
jgi:hypothetical protein